MLHKISFQRYIRAYLPACRQIGVEVFPIYGIQFTKKGSSKVMNAHIDSCYALSTYSELAIVDKKVVGFIFGRIKRRFNPINFLKRLVFIAIRFLRGKYGNRKNLFRFIIPCIQEANNLNKNLPPNEGEVVLFAVAPKYHNKGIGRMLMDRFVSHALRHGSSILAVPTDETVSYWFYERYGFRKWAEFKDSILSYCARKPIIGFTYQLVLNKTDNQ